MTADPSAAADTLRDELAAALDRCTCSFSDGLSRDCPSHGDKYAPADALLPVMRRYADAQVAAERDNAYRAGYAAALEDARDMLAAAAARGQS